MAHPRYQITAADLTHVRQILPDRVQLQLVEFEEIDLACVLGHKHHLLQRQASRRSQRFVRSQTHRQQMYETQINLLFR